VNAITPVNAPVIDPTIGQVNFPRRISVADRAAAATVGAKALCHSVHAIRARHIVVRKNSVTHRRARGSIRTAFDTQGELSTQK